MKVRSCPAITFAADVKLRGGPEIPKAEPEHGKPEQAVHRCRQVLATEKVPSWQLKAFKYYYMPMKDAGLAASWLSRPPSEAAEETDSPPAGTAFATTP